MKRKPRVVQLARLACLLGSLLLLLCAVQPRTAHAQDNAIFQQYMLSMGPQKTRPTGELLLETARFFLGRPYVANTLEHEPEGLVINFRELDCMTLVETSLALTRTLRDRAPSITGYAGHLQRLRYRNGFIGDYTDRLHYAADWIHENERAGLLRDVTREIVGQPLQIKVSFVTDKPDLYKQLRGRQDLVAKMAAQERAINARACAYIPKADIDTLAPRMQNGDIVCFVTSRKGLDISHMGVICKVGNKLTFIHASTTAKKVVLEKKSLREYAQGIASNIGIMVVRPQFEAVLNFIPVLFAHRWSI